MKRFFYIAGFFLTITLLFNCNNAPTTANDKKQDTIAKNINVKNDGFDDKGLKASIDSIKALNKLSEKQLMEEKEALLKEQKALAKEKEALTNNKKRLAELEKEIVKINTAIEAKQKNSK